MDYFTMSNLTFGVSFPISLNTFLDNYIHNVQRVDKRVEEYAKDPNVENIHDIRTAIRRLEASYQSSPNKLQKKNMKKYVGISKSLFKLNSEIRDFDIVLEKLSNEGQLSEQQLEPLKKTLVRKKDKKLSKALSVAIDLRNLNVPHPSKDSNFYKHEKMQKKLTKKYNKLVNNFASRIEKNLPVVISDYERIEELHEIRKDSKKLRYMLELLLSGKDKSNENVDKDGRINETKDNDIHGVPSLIGTLQNIQDMLGIIHDYDITIAYLKEHHKYEHNDVENNIATVRKNKYEQFVQYCKSDLLKSGDGFFINKYGII
jgi:CHAD domain-containing protein